ncbi:MAG: hypothetical protein L6Q81_03115 [Bacteroidia bacterium]|nr:hypothetical protein [Bacteroidia bacterium]
MPDKVRRILSWIYPVHVTSVLSKSGSTIEINRFRGKLYLDTGLVNYSYGALQDVFDNVFESENLYAKPLKNVLILGFGGGSVAELLFRKNAATISITGVESDEEIISISKKYFPVFNRPTLNVIVQDAKAFCEEHTATYDLIIVDLFQEDQVPEKFQSIAFIRNLSRLCSINGMVLFNTIAEQFSRNESASLYNNLSENFRTCRKHNVTRAGTRNTVYVAEK